MAREGARSLKPPSASPDTPSPTNIIEVHRLFARTACRYLVAPVEEFCVDPIAFDQAMEVIPPPTVALLALDFEHVELAHQVAKNNRAFTGHDSVRCRRGHAVAERHASFSSGSMISHSRRSGEPWYSWTVPRRTLHVQRSCGTSIGELINLLRNSRAKTQPPV